MGNIGVWYKSVESNTESDFEQKIELYTLWSWKEKVLKLFSFLFQETAECQCKANVEPGNCDTCKAGSFDLQEANPDGCTDCFCSGKSTFCLSHDRLVRSKVSHLTGWPNKF